MTTILINFFSKTKPIVLSERLILRLPVISDYEKWVVLRKKSEDFLNKWEPAKDTNYYSKNLFSKRVKWAKKKFDSKIVLHFFIFLRSNNQLVGGITLDNIRHGPFQSATLGYWLGEEFSKKGIMTEGLNSMIIYANKSIGVSRIEAATLPNNIASRRLLEKCKFKYEGVGQYYLQIKGKWQHHILYANISDSRKSISNKSLGF